MWDKVTKVLFASSFIAAPAMGAEYNESDFAEAIAKGFMKNVIETEHKLPNRKRVDILTTRYACEVDWISKAWSEGIGQALHYAMMTDKEPCVVVLIDKMHEENLRALLNTARKYNVYVEIYHANKQTGRITKQ